MIRCGFSVNLPGARNGDRAFSIVLRPTIAIRSGDARGATSKPIAARVGSAFANQVHAAVVPIAPVLSDPAALRKFLELARSASHAPFQRNECQLHQSRRLQAYCRLNAGMPAGLGSPSRRLLLVRALRDKEPGAGPFKLTSVKTLSWEIMGSTGSLIDGWETQLRTK